MDMDMLDIHMPELTDTDMLHTATDTPDTHTVTPDTHTLMDTESRLVNLLEKNYTFPLPTIF